MSSRYASVPIFTTWIVPGALYLALAAGAGNPVRCHESSCDYAFEYLAITAALAFVLPLLRGTRSVITQSVLLGLAFWALALYGAASPLPAFVYGKAFGAFIASVFVLVLANHLIVTGGAIALAQGVSRAMMAVFVAAITFKAPDALFNRDVPYLINGPIVFGWLMGAGAICALYIALRQRTAEVRLTAICLALGVLWSGSKGPILAYVMSALTLYSTCGAGPARKLMRVAAYAVIFLLAAVIAAQFIDVYELLQDTRLGPVLDIADSGIDYTEGSVGIRAASYQSALTLIADNLLVGIGPGTFAMYEPVLMYPHNVHLEILLEYGLIPFVLYVGMLLYALIFRGVLIRSLVLFYGLCLSFSGDVSYLRFLLPFLLLPMGTRVSLKSISGGTATTSDLGTNEKAC